MWSKATKDSQKWPKWPKVGEKNRQKGGGKEAKSGQKEVKNSKKKPAQNRRKWPKVETASNAASLGFEDPPISASKGSRWLKIISDRHNWATNRTVWNLWWPWLALVGHKCLPRIYTFCRRLGKTITSQEIFFIMQPHYLMHSEQIFRKSWFEKFNFCWPQSQEMPKKKTRNLVSEKNWAAFVLFQVEKIFQQKPGKGQGKKQKTCLRLPPARICISRVQEHENFPDPCGGSLPYSKNQSVTFLNKQSPHGVGHSEIQMENWQQTWPIFFRRLWLQGVGFDQQLTSHKMIVTPK